MVRSWCGRAFVAEGMPRRQSGDALWLNTLRLGDGYMVEYPRATLPRKRVALRCQTWNRRDILFLEHRPSVRRTQPLYPFNCELYRAELVEPEAKTENVSFPSLAQTLVGGAEVAWRSTQRWVSSRETFETVSRPSARAHG